MLDVKIGGLTVGNDRPLLVIAGPCQLEGTDHALMIAEQMAEVCAKAGAQFVFKGSYDKANRTSLSGKRGLGIDEGLKVLQTVNQTIGCPTLTDIHGPDQCATVASVVDVLQIPAFLCRQTDLLVAAGETGAVMRHGRLKRWPTRICTRHGARRRVAWRRRCVHRNARRTRHCPL